MQRIQQTGPCQMPGGCALPAAGPAAQRPAAEAPAIAFDIWKAGDGLPGWPYNASKVMAEPPPTGPGHVAASRQASPTPVPELQLPALDSKPDAWI